MSDRGSRRVGDVVVALTAADLRSRYGRGPWRLAKWVLDPFALVGVYLLLVAFVLDRGGEAPGLSLACAVVPFQLVMMAVVNGSNAITQRRSTILNLHFERVLIPLAGALTEAVAFAGSLLLLALMMVLYGIAPTAALVWLPTVVAVNVLLAIGCAYGAALIGLWFADLRPFLVSFVRTMFFLAPGLVALSEVEGRARTLLRVNPLTGIFEAYRAVLLEGARPAAWQLLIPTAAAVLLLLVFVPLTAREQRQFAKVL